MTNELLEIGIQPVGHRLPDDARVGRVRLQVSDLDTSLAYYTRVLGFRVASQQGTVAELRPQDGPVLVELHERPGARPVPRRGLLGHHHVGTNTWAAGAPAAGADDARLLEWELRLPAAKDIAAAAASAARAGYGVRIDEADRLMTDPWGTTVRLTQRSNP